MSKKQLDDPGWLEGRDRPVRVYLTEEEHALVRAAAARADKSVSRFAVEAIIKDAEFSSQQAFREALKEPDQVPEPAPPDKPAKAAGVAKGKRRAAGQAEEPARPRKGTKGNKRKGG